MSKRTHEDDDELPPHLRMPIVNPESTQGTDIFDAPHKRARQQPVLSYELERAQSLIRDLQRLGEDPYLLEKDWMNFSNMLAYFWGEEEFRNCMMQYLCVSLVEMPHKVVHFSILIILSNAGNSSIGLDIIQWLKDRLNDAFTDKIEMPNVKGWNRIKLILRALALLTSGGIISDKENLINYWKEILNLSVQLQNENDKRVALSEMLFYEFTISIPYLNILNSNDELKDFCNNLLSISRNFISKPEDGVPQLANAQPMSDLMEGLVDTVESYLDDMKLWEKYDEQLVVMTKDILEKKAEKDLVMSGQADAESVPIVGNVETHTIGYIDIENLKEKSLETESIVDKLWLKPRYMTNLFSNERTRRELDFKTVPLKTNYVSMIIRDIIDDILINVEYNRVTVSKQLLILPVFFNQKLFARPNSQLDRLMIINDFNNSSDYDLVKNIEQNNEFPPHVMEQMIESAKNIQADFEQGFKSTWKMDEIILESVIDIMFTVPSIKLPLVYFESMLTDTTGRDWAYVKKYNNHEAMTFSKLIGDCFRYFYDNIQILDRDNCNKLVNWFLFQISNYKFEWEWQEWVPDVLHLGSDAIYNKKINFIRNAIHKAMLITNYKYIKDKTLPNDLKYFANLALNKRESLINFDAQFYGDQFANMNTQDPFSNLNDQLTQLNENDYERIIETNTDAYKLFDQYFFNHEDHKYHNKCRDIYMNLENIEASIDSFIEITNDLRNIISETSESERVVQNTDQYLITLIIQSVCLIGSRSFSVLEEGMNKVFGGKVQAIVDSIEDDRKYSWIVNAVLRLWNLEPRIGMLFLSKFAKFGVIDDKSIINAGWNAGSGKIMPVCELWMEEFLDSLIETSDNKHKLIVEYMTNAVSILNKRLENVDISKEELNNLTDESEDWKWGIKGLIELIDCKFRKFKDVQGIEMTEFEAIVSSIDGRIV